MRRPTLILAAVLLGACTTTPANQDAALAPFDLASGRPVVAVTLKDGNTVPFIFDTGAMGGSVSQALVARLGLPVIGKALIGSPHGGASIEADVVEMGRVAIGPVEAKLTTATSAAQLDSFAPGGAGNILGPRQFTDKVVEFDFASNQIWIGTRPRKLPEKWFRLDEKGLLSGTAQLNGQAVPFIVDVGNPAGIVMSLALARSLKPQANWSDTGRRMGPIGAQHPLYIGNLDISVNLGGLNAEIRTVGALDGAPDYLNLGTQALRGLTLVIDNPRGQWGILGIPPGPLTMVLPNGRPTPPKAD